VTDSSLTPVLGLRRESTAPRAVPHLFVALDCDRPRSGASRHALAAVDGVSLVRGAARSAERAEGRLTLTVPDRWMSSSHAQLHREEGRWLLEDLGSTNGTHVGGEPVHTHELRDGDVIEMGHTLLLYKEALPLARGSPDVDSGSLAPAARGFATLAPGLAIELASLQSMAPSKVPVVVLGESGTGKELMARAAHELSGRRGPFVAVNCGGIAPNLVESELFGYRKGAFSGALEDRPGLVRAADGGTLFLDEIGDLPAAAQAALLRTLQEGEVLAVGATKPVHVDVRLVSATHRDLEAMAAKSEFRADLLARISGFTVRLPPLRKRREDLALLVAGVVPEGMEIAPDAARALFAHPWPLNVRELEKTLQAAVVLAGAGPLELVHLPEAVRASLAAPAPAPEKPAAPASEGDAQKRDELIGLLREHKGNISAVARIMSVARMQIHRWMKRHQIDPRTFRG